MKKDQTKPKDSVTVTVKLGTHARLDSKRIYPRETFDDIINRVLDKAENTGEAV